MRAIKRLAIFVGLLLLINVVAFATFSTNLHRGVYPVDADSIGIPIAETFATSLAGLVISSVLCIVTGFPALFKRAGQSRQWTVAVAVFLALVYLLAFIFYGLWAFIWIDTNHWPIALVAAAAACATVKMSWHDFKQVVR